ncbi:ABC transporter ATP-binding protein [Sinomonas soli]
MLSVSALRVAGRHGDLVPLTSFDAAPGELTLVRGDGQEHRTALALAATGRCAPSSGTVRWGAPQANARRDLGALRRVSAIVDAPEVNEAELHLRVRDLVAEDLALLPRRYRGAIRPEAWLTVNAFADIAGEWAQDLPAARRTELLTALALANPETAILVLDSPDRHTDDPSAWLPFLAATAARPGRPLAVVAAVGDVPDGWAGPTAEIGNAVQQDAQDADLTEVHA